MEDAIMEELGDFGCLIPNCEETFWRYYAQDQYYDERFEGFSNVRFFFPSKKVTYFNFQTIHRMIRNQVLFVISKILLILTPFLKVHENNFVIFRI